VSHDATVYEPQRRILTIAEAAEHLRCSRRTVERLIARGDLAPVRVASRRRLRIEELDRYLEREERV
jgi:excisionase family DNA binding protein